jgi:hypothetical protein
MTVTFLGILLTTLGLQGPAPLDGCWKGSTTNGSNPGLNKTLLCISVNNAVELRVYFPNTPIKEPPTTCLSRGRRSDTADGGFRVLAGEGQCDNGSSMGGYDLRCTVAAQEVLLCSHVVASGDLVDVRFEKVFP